MRDQNDRFVWVFLDFCKEIVTLTLKCFIADCKYLIEYQNISLRLNGYGKCQANLHTGGVVFQLLIHEVFQLGKLDNIIVHAVNFLASEPK